MKIPFYLLGLLIRYGPQHGYRLKQIIEERVSDFAKIKLPTIYYHLQKLREQGYITEHIDKDGNRPEKMVYSITESGVKHFDDLFLVQLKEKYLPEFPLDGVLYFKERTNKDELLGELERKKEEILIKLNNLDRHQANTLSSVNELGRFSAEAIFEHHRFHLEAEAAWLEYTIKGLVK